MNLVPSVARPDDLLWLEPSALDQICPMHVLLSDKGSVLRAGPTLLKLVGEGELIGAQFLEVFEVLRPKSIGKMQELMEASGETLKLRLRSGRGTTIKAVLTPIEKSGGALVNFGFGISLIDAVREFQLVASDFAVTDLAMELLYLVEAKSAAMEASRSLNERLQTAMIAAEERAYTDTLTGLKNRRALDHVLAQCVTKGLPFAVMQIDLDHFKAVNDTLGHAAGDHVLRNVAQILRAEVRAADTVSRIGGDEFVLILPGHMNGDALEALARRLITRFEEPMPFGEALCRISGSCGSVVSDGACGRSAAQLLDDADKALYLSKNKGRAQHQLYRPELRDNAEPRLKTRRKGELSADKSAGQV